jgi:6-pyruvoyl-tetrahydropterin synthase
VIVATAYLTRVVTFTAQHRLRRADQSPADGAREFGPAAQDHSHDYACRVTVAGPLDARRGGVANLGALDRILREEVVDRFHGRHLNETIPDFGEGRDLPTGEALAVYIWERVAPRLPPGVRLHAIRVQEGPHLYSEYFGEP